MEFDRRVQIRVDRLEKEQRKKGFGSGYLVGPRLVLTAAHVLDHADPDAVSPVTVSLPDTGERQFPAVVRWQRMDETVDAALIEIVDGHDWQVPQSLSDLLTRPPQRYGLIIGTRPHPVTASGFPRLQKDTTDGRRLDEQFVGHIAPGTGSLAGRYELTGTDPTPAGATGTPGSGSRWSGMSGSAVLAHDGYGSDLLCGVMRRDRQADNGTRLTATPTARLLADDAFRALITEHTGWEPSLEPVEPAALLTPAAVARNLRSPAALLRADAEAVAFHGRESELADLHAWCETGPPAIQVRVLTGPGGQGKTRLARRLTDTLGWRGWVTGHLSPDLTDAPTPDAAPSDFTALTTSLPLLLVVDYAETRPRLLRQLITHLHRSRHRVRVLLLARSDGQWRTGSLQATADVRDLLEEAPVIPLAPLIPTSQAAQDRRHAFHRAAHDLALLLPLLPALPSHEWTALAAALRPPADMHEPRYDNVLTLQMAALVGLLQHGPRPVDSAPGTPPERILLQHEDRFWEASADSPAYRLGLSAPTLAAAVAVAALCGAGTKDEAVRVITTLPSLPAHQTATTAAWLASLYPADGDRYWGSLQPDRIAEYHASRTLTDGDIALPALLSAAAPGQQAQLITLLARAAIAHYNTGRTTASEQVLTILDTALDAAPLSHQGVQSAADALPYPSRVTAPLALRLTTVLAHTHKQLAAGHPAAYEPGLATSLSNLGIRLAEAGRRGEALTAAEEAGEIWRRLAQDNPAAYEPSLAGSLTNLGIRLAEAGRHDEAMTTTDEAVVIYRQMAQDNPAAYESNLATSLSNLGIQLAGMGRRGEALTATDEAVVIYRRLAQDNPAAYEPSLAGSLSNLGIRLAEAGRRSEALTIADEAVVIYRRLAQDNPAAYEPNLAGSLSNLGNRLAEAGRRSEALTAEQEAVEIWRRLAQDNPAAYEPSLATSLSNLGIRLAEAGRRSEALTIADEAVVIYRRLAQDNPAAYEPSLATSLSNLGNRLAEAGRHDEALTAEQEAVEIRRRLAQDNPAAYEPDLATSLSNLGNRLAEAGRHDKALTAAEEAVDIRRRLAQGNPAAYEPSLAGSLNNLGNRLAEAGRHDKALTAAEEAVDIRRRLAQGNPAAYEPNLATSLSNLGNRLAEAGRHDEALTAEQEAVEIRRRLAQDNPAAYEPDLATSLSNLGIRLAEAGRRSEALTTAEEAVDIRRRLAQGDPAAYEPDLAGSLTNLGIRLAEAGRHDEAMTTTDEAVVTYRRLAQDNPAAYEPDLATSLSNLGNRLAEAGRHDKALTAAEEAVKIRRRLAQDNPAAYEPNLATSLSNLGIRLAQAGRHDEALTTTNEAVVIYRRLAQDNPAAYEPNLATSLTVLAMLLAAKSDLYEALRATEEGLDLYSRHVATAPPLLPRLHAVMGLQADLLDGLGLQEESETVRRWLRENPLPPDSPHLEI
ncbi:tetratricopeptide repeat protein [Streptomyces sp. NPDC048224]|uniref:tetratricopeptide repeat protein n=1 Tax=Streptomyces sp. NPDC048224 TaxID=3154500 RepID=UPI0033C5A67F